jgi:hypothetical protein
MSTVEDYTKNPDQLLGLVREVIDHLEAEDKKSEIAEMEAQLREIARAVEKLEKLNVPVPDALRAEKTRLVAAVSTQSDSALALIRLTEGLEEIVKELKPTSVRNTEPKTSRRTGRQRSTRPRTSARILRETIIEALRHYGGLASKRDVHRFIEEKLKGQFLPKDMERRQSTNDYIWKNNTDWERFKMIQEGILKKGSPIGIWELSEEYR